MLHPHDTTTQQFKLRVVHKHLQGRLGETDGKSVIYLDPRQSRAQYRSTLAHELAHVFSGHTHGCSPAEEARVEDIASRILIPVQKLIAALKWSSHIEEIAEELEVDLPTVQARLSNLSEREHAELRCALEE